MPHQLLESLERSLRVALVVLITCVVAYVVMVWYADRSAQPHIRAMEEFRQRAETAVAYADSLAQITDARQQQIDELETKVEDLRRQLPDRSALEARRSVIDSIYVSLPPDVLEELEIIPMQQELLAAQDSIIQVLDAIVLNQADLIVLQGASMLELTASRDSLRTVLVSVPPPAKEERFLGFLPMPSRKAAFVAGVVTTVVVGVVLN